MGRAHRSGYSAFDCQEPAKHQITHCRPRKSQREREGETEDENEILKGKKAVKPMNSARQRKRCQKTSRTIGFRLFGRRSTSEAKQKNPPFLLLFQSQKKRFCSLRREWKRLLVMAQLSNSNEWQQPPRGWHRQNTRFPVTKMLTLGTSRVQGRRRPTQRRRIGRRLQLNRQNGGQT